MPNREPLSHACFLFEHHISSWLVAAQADEGGMAHLSVFGPFRELDFTDQFRPDPGGGFLVRNRLAEWLIRPDQGFKPCMQGLEAGSAKTGAGVADIAPSAPFAQCQHQSAEMFARFSRSSEADDDNLLSPNEQAMMKSQCPRLSSDLGRVRD